MKSPFTKTVTTSVDYDVITVDPKQGIQFVETVRTEEKRYISYEDFMAHFMTEKDWNDSKVK